MLHRSTLSVPGHRENMHAKALASAADAIMLDLEDSVPVDQKESALEAVIATVAAHTDSEKALMVRINALDTPFGYRDLQQVVEAVGERLDAVVVPKVDHPGDIHFVSRMLDGIQMRYGRSHRVGIEAFIESAPGLTQVSAIAAASDRLDALIWGIADYSASIGARLASISGHGEESDGYPGHRWHFEMSRIVMAAKANGLLAIDAPHGNFKDTAGLAKGAAMACALGFDGKWAIHPVQIDTINEVFTPSAEDIARALRVLEAYAQAREAGQGAAAVDGRMIDAATVRMARQLKAQAEQLGLA